MSIVTTPPATAARSSTPARRVYTVNYAYDELGRPKDVKENGSTVLASWTYVDRLNALVTYANTTTCSVQSTSTGELAKLTNTLGGGEAPQFNFFYNKSKKEFLGVRIAEHLFSR